MNIPVLYTFRRCPYAIRARMSLYYAGIDFRIREIDLKQKPKEMLDVSPKGTVPVLVVDDNAVIDESLEIMHWAIQQSDPEGWINMDCQSESEHLILVNDKEFKPLLDNYKYPQSSEKQDPLYYRDLTQPYLIRLNHQISQTGFLVENKINIADIALFPFIRQYAMVDKAWFDKTPYPHLQQWLQYFLSSDLFQAVMKKYQPWSGEDEPVLKR